MIRRVVFLALLVSALLVLAPPAGSQRRAEVFTFSAPTGASAQAFDVTRFGGFASKHTLQFKVTGSPSGCAFRFDGTNLGPEDNPTDADFADLSGSITCTANSAVHIVNKPIRTVRMYRTTWAGGTSPTLTVYYSYAP